MNTRHLPQQADVMRDRFGLRVAARLSAGTQALPHDIQERLRVARHQALARRKQPPRTAPAETRVASALLQNGNPWVLGLGDDGLGFWGRLVSAALVVALAIGLVAVHVVQSDDRAFELANLDAALLSDDLPLQAYTDPGFLQYLKSGAERSDAFR